MSKVVEKAEEVKQDVVDLAEEAGKELQETAADLTDQPKKEQKKLGAALKKYGIPALAFGLGWVAKTCWIMLTGSSADSAASEGNVVDMPVAGPDNTAI